MQNDGEVVDTSSFQFFCDCSQSVEVQFCFAFEFVCTVACADSNCQRVNACSCYEVNSLIGVCVCCISCVYFYFVFHACQFTQFRFYYYASFVCVFNDFLCLCYVFFVVQVRTVEHYGCEAVFDTVFANFEIRTVIQMQSNIQTCFFNCSIYHCFQVFGMRIFQCRFGNLQNNSGVLCFCSSNYTLNDFHVIDVESADCITAFECFFKHFFCCY